MSRLSRIKKSKTHNYRCQMEELGALKALSVADESAGGSVSPKSESCTRTWAQELAHGGVLRIKDWRLEACQSLVDTGFLMAGRSNPGAPGGGVSSQRWSSRRKSSP